MLHEFSGSYFAVKDAKPGVFGIQWKAKRPEGFPLGWIQGCSQRPGWRRWRKGFEALDRWWSNVKLEVL